MPDFRVFIESSESKDLLNVSERESQHLIKVCRARVGDFVRAFDGYGKEWDTELLESEKRHAVLRVLKEYSMPPPKITLNLAQALPKGKTMDGIIRGLTEIGISTIQPLKTRYSEVQLGEERSEGKIGKWSVTALEACKQSGNSWIPQIYSIQSMLPWLETLKSESQLRVIASLEDGSMFCDKIIKNWMDLNGKMPSDILMLVGPEGDFSKEEYQAAAKAGFQPLRLAKNVLRVETAALYMASLFDQIVQSNQDL